MKPENTFIKVLLAGVLSSLYTSAMADIYVDKSNGMLTVTSDISGIVKAKIVGPNDEVMVDENYSGSLFSWVPSSGPDGAYRYDVRVVPQVQDASSAKDLATLSADASIATNKSDYAGGSVEVKNGQIANEEEEVQ